MLLAVTLAAASRVQLEVVKTPLAAAPRGWRVVGDVDPDTPLLLSFHMRHSKSGLAELERMFDAVSEPTHKLYGRHLSSAAIAALLAPPRGAAATVSNWLATVGAPSLTAATPAGDVLEVEMAAGAAAALLNCSWRRYHHPKMPRGTSLIRTRAYSVPTQVAEVVAFVGGTIRFPRLPLAVRAPRVRHLARDGSHSTPPKAKLPSLGVTPDVLRNRYNASSADAAGVGVQGRQAVASFLGQYFDAVDLEEFYALFMPSMAGSYPDKVVGKQGLVPGVEANLDVQYITTVAYRASTWVYSNDGLHENQEPFLKWLSTMANESDADVPKVASVSYGDDEDTITPMYMQAVNTQAMALGARGISLLFASGDDGASCTADGSRFLPSFPAELPTVTTVGGTDTDGLGETGPDVTNSISGGGFSDYFARPTYQSAAVTNWLANGMPPPAKYFNASGRAYPDVSALSNMFWVTYLGIPEPVAGTSASCPTFAAMLTLVNAARARAGTAPVGFANPWLYRVAAARGGLTDVTQYCSSGCDSNNGIGFCAVPGWDPATGLGAPNMGMLATL